MVHTCERRERRASATSLRWHKWNMVESLRCAPYQIWVAQWSSSRSISETQGLKQSCVYINVHIVIVLPVQGSHTVLDEIVL